MISKCERVWRWIEASSKEETFRVMDWGVLQVWEGVGMDWDVL